MILPADHLYIEGIIGGPSKEGSGGAASQAGVGMTHGVQIRAPVFSQW